MPRPDAVATAVGTVLALLGAAAPAAEPIDREALPELHVIGAEENLKRIPGSGLIIDQEELRQSRVFTINEALRKAPGVHVRDEEGFGLRPNIGMRGLNPTRSTKTLLLEDGLPLTYAPYGDNASYSHPPIERFDRIEILRGSGQVLYGPQTIGGVINYITPTPPQEFGGLLRLGAGNRDYLNGHLTLGGRGLRLDIDRKQGDHARDNNQSELTDVALKGVFELGERQALTVRGNFFDEDSDVSYSGITEAERRNFGLRYNPFVNDEFDTERYAASVTHEFDFGGVELLTSVYGTHFTRDWWRQSSTTTDTQCGTAFRDARLAGQAVDVGSCASAQGRLRDYYTYGIEPRLLFTHDALFGYTSELQAGFRAHFEEQERVQRNGASARARTGRAVEDNRREVDAYSGFLQNRISLGLIEVVPALRVEHVIVRRENNLTGASGETSFTDLIPGLGFTFNPTPRATLFAGIHRGFAPPRTEDLIDTPGGAGAAPVATFTEVNPERSWNFEAGARTQPADGLRFEVTFFRNDFENQIAVGSIAGGATPLAEGETLYQGLELFGRLDSAALFNTYGNIYVQGAYTRVGKAEQTSPFVRVSDGTAVGGSAAGLRVPYAPENLFTGVIGYTHPYGWDVQVEAVYIGEQFADFANTRVAPENGNGQVGLIEQSLVFNTALNVPVRPWNATLFLTAKNVFDRDFIVDRTRGILPGLPLLVQGGVEFSF